MPKLDQPPGGQAIIDDRRVVAEIVTPEAAAMAPWRRRCWPLRQPVPASGLVLVGPLLAAIQGAARQPLAFPVQDIANRLTTGGATVACRVAD